MLKNFILFLFIISSSQVTLASNCTKVANTLVSRPIINLQLKSQKIFGEEVQFQRVPQGLLKNGKVSSSILNSEKAAFIGIKENGHSYIIAGDYRFDGEFIYNKPLLRKGNPKIHEGIVIRLEDEDGSLKRNIEAYFNTHGAPRAINCVDGVCKIIGSSLDLETTEEIIHIFTPHKLLKRIIKGEFYNSHFEELQADLFIVGEKPIENIINTMKSRVYKVTTTLGVTAAFMGFYFIDQNN